MGKYIELNNANFDSVVEKGVSLVDFWAPWCGPCRMLSPIIDELAEEYEGKANICKVNTDDEEELGARFGIRSIPSILFFVDGRLVETMVGASSKQVLSDKIKSLM